MGSPEPIHVKMPHSWKSHVAAHFSAEWYSNRQPANIFNLKILSDFKNAAYFQMHFRLDFFMRTNNMIPDQTGPNEAV